MHILDGFGVVSQNAEIVNRVAIHGIAVDFFVVIEDAVAPEGAGADDMTVRQDVSAPQVSVSWYIPLDEI